jgi:hypothetical protein
VDDVATGAEDAGVAAATDEADEVATTVAEN